MSALASDIAIDNPADNLKGPLWLSVLMHGALAGFLIYSGIHSHTGDLWGGAGGAITVGLVGNVPGIPMPRPEMETPNRVVDEYGEADAYGHRKKVDIGHALADELQRRTGEETIESDLTYDLRSGEPDAIDQIVAITYANIALDLIRDGVTGRMVGVQNGCYASAPLPASSAGARRVDVATLYNTERYRPNYTAKLGAPLLFGHD